MGWQARGLHGTVATQRPGMQPTDPAVSDGLPALVPANSAHPGERLCACGLPFPLSVKWAPYHTVRASREEQRWSVQSTHGSS